MTTAACPLCAHPEHGDVWCGESKPAPRGQHTLCGCRGVVRAGPDAPAPRIEDSARGVCCYCGTEGTVLDGAALATLIPDRPNTIGYRCRAGCARPNAPAVRIEDSATRCRVCTGTFTIDEDAQAHRGEHDRCNTVTRAMPLDEDAREAFRLRKKEATETTAARTVVRAFLARQAEQAAIPGNTGVKTVTAEELAAIATLVQPDEPPAPEPEIPPDWHTTLEFWQQAADNATPVAPPASDAPAPRTSTFSAEGFHDIRQAREEAEEAAASPAQEATPPLSAATDAQLAAALDSGLADLALAERYEHNAHLVGPIRAWLDRIRAEQASRAALTAERGARAQGQQQNAGGKTEKAGPAVPNQQQEPTLKGEG